MQNIKKDTRCISPFTQQKTGLNFGCGKCVNCKKRKISAWSYRLMQQQKISDSAWFITLTYTTDTVPITDKGRMSLDPVKYYDCCRIMVGKNRVCDKTVIKHQESNDVQRFLKKLRKLHTNKISYYLCGEYGTERYRPHYHAIMFNVELEHLIGKEMATKAMNYKDMLLTGKTQFDCPTWGKGHITIGRVSGASIGYVLEYISKPERIPQYKGDDRFPEFSLMSKGIGKNYIDQEMQDWHKADLKNRYYAPLEDGKKAPLPRYYKEKLYTQNQREKIGIYLQKKEDEENKTKSMKQKQKEMQNLSAYRETLATTAHRDKRKLKY